MAKVNCFELKTKIQALFAEYPELAEDEDLRFNTLEGETELFFALGVIVDDVKSAEYMQTAIALRIKELKSRQDRYERREIACRKLAQDLMATANQRKITLTEATLSIRSGQPAVRLIDEKDLPESFWRVKREPNLQAIKDALKSGLDVPGAALSNAPETLTITVK